MNLLKDIAEPLTPEEKERCIAYAHWLKDYMAGKHPGPHEVDAWNLYRWNVQLLATSRPEEEPWDQKP